MTPATPLVNVSPKFRNQAIRSVLAIALFVLVYLILLAFALSSVYFALLGAWALLGVFPRLITFIAGLGMIAAAGLFVYFMLKFLFHRSVTDNTQDIEVTREEEPRLFAMIDEIVSRLDVKPPRKVFLGPEVNASVTYNSSFWSMFFPVRKNLRIGIGLINSLHTDELRAVIAHEFGHFSQRSMAVGSYVYNVNYVIFQLVNDDQNFTDTAYRIASSSIYVYPFAMVAIYAVQVTRWLIAKMYGLVNLSYLGLSREMEYHADAVAASLGGGYALASGLRRIELADSCYNRAMGFTASQLAENNRVKNLYQLQSRLLQETAIKDGLPMTDGLPDVSETDNNRYLKSKIEAGRQWASHPEIEDRIAQLQLSDINPTKNAKVIANELLTDPARRQEQFTGQLTGSYRSIERCIDQEEATSLHLLLKEEEENTLPAYFNGYYNSHNLKPDASTDILLTDEDLFTEDDISSVNAFTVLQHDLVTIEAIKGKIVDLKTFDYDGKKYKRREAVKLADSLKPRLEELKEQVLSHDQQVMARAFAWASQLGSETQLREEINNFLLTDELFDKYNEVALELRSESAFMQEILQIDDIKHRMIMFKSRERDFREALQLVLDHDNFNSAASPFIREDVENFLSKKLFYFRYDTYDGEAIGLLFTNIDHLEYLLTAGFWRAKRNMLTSIANLLSQDAEENILGQ